MWILKCARVHEPEWPHCLQLVTFMNLPININPPAGRIVSLQLTYCVVSGGRQSLPERSAWNAAAAAAAACVCAAWPALLQMKQWNRPPTDKRKDVKTHKGPLPHSYYDDKQLKNKPKKNKHGGHFASWPSFPGYKSPFFFFHRSVTTVI